MKTVREVCMDKIQDLAAGLQVFFLFQGGVKVQQEGKPNWPHIVIILCFDMTSTSSLFGVQSVITYNVTQQC